MPETVDPASPAIMTIYTKWFVHQRYAIGAVDGKTQWSPWSRELIYWAQLKFWVAEHVDSIRYWFK